MSKLRVAMIAPPWLRIPPVGYGGIEAVLDGLIPELAKNSIEVHLFTVRGTKHFKGVKIHSLYDEEQYKNIHHPMYESLPILAAHMQFALNYIKKDGKFDIIHDHNGFYGPHLLAWATSDLTMPPAVHTLHGPPFTNQAMLDQDLPDNNFFWQQLSFSNRSYIIGISDSLMASAPASLKPVILPTVYNAIDAGQYIFEKEKKNYYITLARFSRDKAQHVAAELCVKLGYRLRMAGTVAGISSNRRLLLELANPLSPYRSTADFRYYSDYILPLTLRNQKITYVGNVEGRRKLKFLSQAKALLFPIDWEEPFGMAVIEALACGTPVVAMNRGAMSEIIQHGYNGFLANTVEEFAEYMQRVGEIRPEDCRQSVVDKFSADKMALAYIERYKEVIKRDRQTTKP